MSIFKDCDIRGVYSAAPLPLGPDDLTAHDAERIGQAMATLHPGARVCVGGDHRVSTPALKAAFIEGLLASGARVTDLGTIPTPALYFALSRGGFDGGATVTASHNPPRYNGIKYMFGGEPVTREINDALRAAVEAGGFRAEAGALERADVLADYVASMARRFHAVRPLRVVLDAGNGAMGPIAPDAFRRCGYEVIELFCAPDGRFPNRNPNPAEYTCLGAACERVVAEGADFGVAFDGDGDRAVFIDDRGRPVVNERSLVLFIRKLLKDGPTPVVYDQKSSSAVRRATLALGGEPIPERSGHAFIKRRFLEVRAAIAGEVSGHFFFGELGYDDALFAALLMAELLVESDAPLSALADAIALPPITPDLRIQCPYDQQDDWLARVERAALARGGRASHMDGARLEFDDGWLLLRKSITAEQVTLRAEADTPQRLRSLLDMAASALPETARAALEDAAEALERRSAE